MLEVLKKMRKTTRFNIELKGIDPVLVEKVADCITVAKVKRQHVSLSSYNFEFCYYLRKLGSIGKPGFWPSIDF